MSLKTKIKWGDDVIGVREDFKDEKFELIYADPPWQYKNKKTGDQCRLVRRNNTM